MSDFKTELHCHTKVSSICGKVTAEDAARRRYRYTNRDYGWRGTFICFEK